MPSPNKLVLSRRVVDALPVAEREALFWDRDLTGFGVRVHPSGSKVYMVQTRARGKTRRVTIGRHGVWTPERARREAGRLLASLKAGETPRRPGADSPSANGPTITCGKRQPAPDRTRCEPCAAKKRPGDRARYRRQAAERVALGLCPKCGKRAPAPGRSQCEPCLEKDAAAGRARDARLRAAGLPRRDMQRAREYDREYDRRVTEARRAEGICTSCGKTPAASGRVRCEPCLEKHRADDRACYAAAKAAGKLYGGADPETKRRAARAKSRRRKKAWLDAGLCGTCGAAPETEGSAVCASCKEKRQARGRRKYAERRAAGLCVKCGTPTFDGMTYCGPCAVLHYTQQSPERRNENARRRYAERRARGQCTDCGAPSQGASRCAACAERSYHGSQHFKGIPLWDPTWTVIEIATGREHGPFESEADVALCLVFEKLRRDQVEVVNDASPMSSYTSWA